MAGRDPYSGMEPWEGAGSAKTQKLKIMMKRVWLG
jgi:hypothetical protein